MKIPPCKEGKLRNANGRCVLAKNVRKTSKVKVSQPDLNINSDTNTYPKKPPCKEGKARNANGRCVMVKNISKIQVKKKTQKIILLKSKNTPEQDAIKSEINVLVSEGKTPTTPLSLDADHLSFSPNINKLFVSNLEDRADIFKCAAFGSFEDLISKFKISVGTKRNGKPDCKKVDSSEAKAVLLKNLNNIKIDENQIIAPVQLQFNCWFNTLFVAFFFSDKGRKFFKYFRRLMILGENSNGTKIPSKLAKGLMLWNLCIEASYGNKDIALAMNTNVVIRKIYNGIPKKDLIQMPAIPNAGKYGNPIDYYTTILWYINNKELSIMVTPHEENVAYKLLNLEYRLPNPVDVLCMNINGLNSLITSSWTKNLDLRNIEILEWTGVGTQKYKLDSVIIRDIGKTHFCSLITCNGKEMAFDGESYSQLKEMKWKQLIGEREKWNQSWSFEYSKESWLKANNNNSNNDSNNDNIQSPKNEKMKWNFAECYVMLFYYKV